MIKPGVGRVPLRTASKISSNGTTSKFTSGANNRSDRNALVFNPGMAILRVRSHSPTACWSPARTSSGNFHRLVDDHHRPVPVAHARAVGQQRVLVQHVAHRPDGDGRDVQLSPFGPLVERFDVLEDVLKLVAVGVDFVRRERVEHERVVRVGRMTQGENFGDVRWHRATYALCARSQMQACQSRGGSREVKDPRSAAFLPAFILLPSSRILHPSHPSSIPLLMNILVLAAGYATRLYPLTLNKAKPLLDVAGKPMLEWVLDNLAPIPDIGTVYIVTNNKFAADFQTWADGYNQQEDAKLQVQDRQRRLDQRPGQARCHRRHQPRESNAKAWTRPTCSSWRATTSSVSRWKSFAGVRQGQGGHARHLRRGRPGSHQEVQQPHAGRRGLHHRLRGKIAQHRPGTLYYFSHGHHTYLQASPASSSTTSRPAPATRLEEAKMFAK